jgi:hypothetical protein
MRIERMHPMTSTAIVIRDEQDGIRPAPVRDRSMAPLDGEKRLMLAVLERAVDDLRTYANVPTGRGRWLFREVSAWFGSPETGPFDFEGICQATGLDPDFIRKGLRRPNAGPQLTTASAETPPSAGTSASRSPAGC